MAYQTEEIVPTASTQPQPTTATKQQQTRVDEKEDEEEEEAVPKTMKEAVRVFFFSKHSGGPTSVAIILATLIPWRFLALPVSGMDAAVFIAVVIFWFFQEHFLHQKVLHSEANWYGKEMHEGHHQRPYFHISLDPAPLMLVWMGTAHAVFQLLFTPGSGLAYTATIGYSLAGLFYEWCHYIVHTRVKPRNQFMKLIRDHHIRHHCVNKRYWLGFSLPAVDTLMGTNPNVQMIRQQNKREKQQQKQLEKEEAAPMTAAATAIPLAVGEKIQ